MEAEIVNRVTNSPLESIDLAEYLDTAESAEFDLTEGLYEGLILKEQDFRQFIKSFDWSQYEGKNVAVFCSADAIVPSWAYMLVASKLRPLANLIAFGSLEDVEKLRVDEAINLLLKKDLTDAKVVIKGCGNLTNRDYAYFEIAKRLIPFVSSLMYGEPCSTVPVYKKPKK